MHVFFVSGELGTQYLRMASFDSCNNCLEVDFVEEVFLDIIPELLGKIVEASVDLNKRGRYFSGGGFVHGEHSSFELSAEDLVFVVGGAYDFHENI